MVWVVDELVELLLVVVVVLSAKWVLCIFKILPLEPVAAVVGFKKFLTLTFKILTLRVALAASAVLQTKSDLDSPWRMLSIWSEYPITPKYLLTVLAAGVGWINSLADSESIILYLSDFSLDQNWKSTAALALSWESWRR